MSPCAPKRAAAATPLSIAGEAARVKRQRTLVSAGLEQSALVAAVPRDAAVVKLPRLTKAPSAYSAQACCSYPNAVDFVPTAPTAPRKERQFVESLDRASTRDDSHLQASQDDYQGLRLTDFTCYRVSDKSHNFTMASLNELKTNNDCSELAFDGRLHLSDADDGHLDSSGKSSTSLRVYGIRFSTVSIEGYDSRDGKPSTAIFIQSSTFTKKDVWYRLEAPSQAYQRYHEPFLWLAEFVIYFVDFVNHRAEYEQDVMPDDYQPPQTTLESFRTEFNDWLESVATRHADFDNWRAQYPSTDFRNLVVTYYDFLWKESTDVAPDAVISIPLWSEIDPRVADALTEYPVEEEEKTLCTPYVFEQFKNSYFGDFLAIKQMKSHVHQQWIDRARQLKMAHIDEDDLTRREQDKVRTKEIYTSYAPAKPESVAEGDVIVTKFDDSGNAWAKDQGFDGMYAYVQGITMRKNGSRKYHLIWLYSPFDTILGTKCPYPFPNEFFMSDHCNCGEPDTTDAHILGKAHFIWRPKDVEHCQQPFIRQTYITPDKDVLKDVSFRALQDHDRQCHCRGRDQSPLRSSNQHFEFPVGSTILYDAKDSDFLEPAIVQRYLPHGRVELRLFERRDKQDARATRCELLETMKTVEVSQSTTMRRCLVRRYAAQDIRSQSVPAPYAYNGTADTWALTGYLDCLQSGQRTIAEVTDLTTPPSFLEAFDPETSIPNMPKMAGLSLFSGAGSFDRGLQEGGALRTKWAVELDRKAAHSYRANLESPGETEIFWGSVNDALKRALRGRRSAGVPTIGEVDLICGGSPCKGFSLATQDRSAKGARGFASLVASVISYADLYRPAHVILENVSSMCNDMQKRGGENTFKSILAALLGMGYQASIYLGDAWAHGSCQNRTRIFIMATAPGLELLTRPPQTHSHPAGKGGHSAGKTSYSAQYGFRSEIDTKCPHSYISAEEATRDLPRHDGMQRTTIAYPSHRTPSSVAKDEQMLHAIPRHPEGMGVFQALHANVLPDALIQEYSTRDEREWWGKISKAFKRIPPSGLFPTVKTSQRYDCSRMGDNVHWDDPRGMTIMEARRAQSIPDQEVFIGSAADQFKQVGNGVDRKISVALGMSLRKSWFHASMRIYEARSRSVKSSGDGSSREQAVMIG